MGIQLRLSRTVVIGIHLFLSMSQCLCLVHQGTSASVSRIKFLRTLGVATAGVSANFLLAGQPALAEGNLPLSDDELKKIVQSDIIDRQFLATGDITRSIYKPTATFTDEIDTYKLDQWVKGTQKLFVGEQSKVRLVGDIAVSPEKIEFRFDEDLMFRIPFRPVVSLTGTVVLKRDETGYITSYQEFWDQDVATVLKSAKF